MILQGANDGCEMNHEGSMAENKESYLEVRAGTLPLTGSVTSIKSYNFSGTHFPQR